MADRSSPESPSSVERSAEFTISFGHRRRMVALLRRFVRSFYDGIVHPRSKTDFESAWASRLSLAAHELVENAVQYGPDGDAKFSIRIDPDPTEPDNGHVVRMTTRNRAHAEQRETARRRVEALNQADDAFAYYLTLMSDSARREEGSGLGLARVRVEADMLIDCSIEGEHLEIAARARIVTDSDAREGDES